MALKNGSGTTNGSGARKCISWTDEFVRHTDNIESGPLFRKWAAISTIAAVLEQKVWVKTASDSVTFPHLYTFLVGPAGKGKSWAVKMAMEIMRKLPEQNFAPTSMNMATLVECLISCKRTIINLPEPAIEYNSMFIVADELSAFMHEYSYDLIAGLTTFYDVEPYGRARVYFEKGPKVIEKPQLNILCGTTPAQLKFMPEAAWEQGFASRLILIFAEDKPTIDIWNTPPSVKSDSLLHDLEIINHLIGQFGWTEEWSRAMHNWKLTGFQPVPNHPKLQGYNERRERHMIKLSMIASVDRGNDLELTKEDFNRAMGWLLEAEQWMPYIFQSGNAGQDSKAMDEILFFVKQAGDKGVNQQRIVNFARTHIMYAHNVMNILNLMENSGMIKVAGIDQKFGLKVYKSA